MLLRSTRFSALLLLAATLASAPYAAHAQAAGARGDDFLYKVMTGDTLIGLAQRYTTGAATWPRLQASTGCRKPPRCPSAKSCAYRFP